MYIRRKVFSVAYDENGEEKLFSTTEFMTEDEYIEKLYAESEKKKGEKDPDEYEELNYTDLIKNIRDKNPRTIKKLREDYGEWLSKEKGKGRLTSAIAGVPAGAIAGGAIGGFAGGKSGAALGALVGGAGGYGADRALRRLRNKIRKSGGGGEIDDAYAREADRIAMLDGKMTKKEFKDKWYRHKQAR